MHPLVFLDHLPRGRCTGLTKRDLEILHRHLARVEPATERRKPRSANKVLEVGASESLGALREALEIDIVRDRHPARVNREDSTTTRSVGSTDIDQLVEA